MSKILIVDYGMANLRSVQKAFEAVGHAAEISSDPNQIATAAKVVLPGVGAFPDAIMRLRETHLDGVIVEQIQRGSPFLGICLGMQMLFARGHENGLHAGLGIFDGEVVPYANPLLDGNGARLKVPHMGWNTLTIREPKCPLFAGLPPNPSVYFVHGYYPVPNDDAIVAATTDYPTPFASVIWRDNIFATQFHPEKSQAIGLKMLANFAAL